MMTDNELLQKVLEHEGWHDVFPAYDWYYGYPKGQTVDGHAQRCPDYLHDRNVVAKLIGQLDEDQFVKWVNCLLYLVKPHWDYDSIVSLPDQQLRAWWEAVNAHL